MTLAAREPFSLIIFGASGHLAKIKLYPALYTLALKKKLPSSYSVIGYARTPMDTAAFRDIVEQAVRADMVEVNEGILAEFLTHLAYQAGQYEKQEGFDALRALLEKVEHGEERTRLLYLSLPPTAYASVIELACASGIRRGRFRCIVEKPVGSDLKSFEKIQDLLSRCLREEEIYLLDHYLGKDAVRNVFYLRYANPMLEWLICNTLIHRIEIAATESLGLEGRAGYFNATGTLRDMVQSHLLQMVALLTMDIGADETSFREVRAGALDQIYLPPANGLGDVIIQGQYTAGKVGREHVVGYREEPGIEVNARTNTFIALKLLVRSRSLAGIPIYLVSGKRLHQKETRISIEFTMPITGPGFTPNRLDIILQGEAGMRISLQTKVGGTDPMFRPLIMNDPLVCMGDCLPEHALLLLEAMEGKQQWFLSFREVRTSWRLTDPLQSYLDLASTPLHTYPAGAMRPIEADEWIARDGIRWL